MQNKIRSEDRDVKQTWPYEPPIQEASFWTGLQVPELTSKGRELEEISRQIPKKAQALVAKRQSSALWLVFVGGTGTGKSTLFNALCRGQVSQTGVERPKTLGAVIFYHLQAEVEKSLPDFLRPGHQVDWGASSQGCAGQPQGVTLIRHTNAELKDLVLVDTPDLDSLMATHRELAQDILLMADLVFFVTSQEKYADDVLYQALVSLASWGKDVHFVLNKVDPPRGSTVGEVLQEVRAFLNAGRCLLSPGHCTALPFVPGGDMQADPGVQAFARDVTLSCAYGRGRKRRQEEESRVLADLKADVDQVLEIVHAEDQAVKAWERRVQKVADGCIRRMLQREETGFQVQERRAVQEELRKVFGRYDVLAGPRRVVGGFLRMPFRILGGGRFSRRARQADLERAKAKADSRPVREAVDTFNLRVLEELLPADEDSRAGHALRRDGLAMEAEEVQSRFQAVQDEMAEWLNVRFEWLAKEAPRGKVWGIYSTSALWGGLIVSFETIIGGGLSLVEVLIDSAVAPYVTKGAVELFAYQELRGITRELSSKLEEGIAGIVREQRDRYIQTMHGLGPQAEAVQAVREWADWAEQASVTGLPQDRQ